jgi:hypothetical protein
MTTKFGQKAILPSIIKNSITTFSVETEKLNKVKRKQTEFIHQETQNHLSPEKANQK